MDRGTPPVTYGPGADGDSATGGISDSELCTFARDGAPGQVEVDGSPAYADAFSERWLRHPVPPEEATEQTSSIAGHGSMPIIEIMVARKGLGFPPKPIVKTGDLYEPLDGMADDRHEAVGWYLNLLVKQELARGYSQVRLSTRTRVSQPILSNIVGGEYEPKLQTIYLLADYFGMAPWQLVKDALDWWENRGGKKYALDQENERHQKRVAKMTQKKAK